MDKLIITGGTPLKGEVTISGAKNAAIAILPATLLINGTCTIENVPNISDVKISCKILEELGAKIDWINDNTLTIDTTNITSTHAPLDLTRKFRASYYLIGSLLSRFKNVEVGLPGGCNLGPRPIDQHIKGFEALGAKVDVFQGKIQAKAKKLIGNSYEVSHLKEYEDEQQKPWASLTKNDDGTYTWSEAYLVNYWSVYDIADQVTGSKYFNRAALGADFAVTTDNTFAVALQEYRIGDSDPVTVQIDNTQGTDENMNLKFISATGSIKSASKNNTGLIVGIVIGACAVVGAVVGGVVAAKKKKTTKEAK